MALTTRTALTVLCCAIALILQGCSAASRPSAPSSVGSVEIRGGQLLRDGRPWIPHGFYQIAFEVAPGDLARADHPFWATAQRHYTPDEYGAMRAAGADSVRLQIAQAGADPASPLFDRHYLDTAVGAVAAARGAGLTVMVSVQDESHVPNDNPIALPDAGTQRVWQEIAPRFAGDHGVLDELLNEPRLRPTPENWSRWADAMTTTIQVVRSTGATNVLIADGLGVGRVVDGAPAHPDPQVAYAAHPYPLDAQDQTPVAWDAEFGTFSAHAPVIITEWLSGGYYCDADTARSTVAFLQYLQSHRVGLEVGTWDWAPGGFGSARWDFPTERVSTFSGRSCHQPGYGLGASVDSWWRTGTPPSSPQ